MGQRHASAVRPPPYTFSPPPPPPLYKLLTLGGGESGKSTFFKNFWTGAPPDRKVLTSQIFANIISTIQTLIEWSSKLATRDPEKFGDCAIIDEHVKRIASEVAAIEIDHRHMILSQSQFESIQAIWSDPGIQRTFSHRCEFQIIEESKYFLDNIQKYMREDFVPDMEDNLRCRVRTAGIVECTREIEGVSYKLFDVGGARNERKKWIHCFENVDAVVFMSAVSEFNLSLYEDEKENRLRESIRLFGDVLDSKVIASAQIFLCFNKIDSMQEKLQKYPFSKYFPEYKGDNSFHPVMEWLQKEFMARDRSGKRPIHVFMTNWTSQDNFSQIFRLIREIVCRRKPLAAAEGPVR